MRMSDFEMMNIDEQLEYLALTLDNSETQAEYLVQPESPTSSSEPESTSSPRDHDSPIPPKASFPFVTRAPAELRVLRMCFSC